MSLDQHTIEKLREGGFLHSKFDHYRDIFKTFTEIRKEKKYEESVELTCEKCHVSSAVVQRAVSSWKKMK